ncbi:zinc ABC transporter substrate-binding protein [Minwuia thermotolerans]|uniref:High-affinity zinc uptake system protein ZnuA n=1 Tax=Minwuia thermotolerans TaxID=2056226 RepID=A0A2M9G7C7_9PROT|nr:zinc ABC transporter substrate-binding protein [Minwuia thermotolerans]PJK31610.1 zinc ABC transporter substrate-binding protein [Minwuia thermotolerans]
MARGLKTGLLAAAAVVMGAASQLSAAPKVVASIQPVHSLAASVMEGVGQPYLLVPPGASPHSHALKPSDARALSEADVVFWIGPAISTFLRKPLEELAGNAEIVTLMDAPGLRLLPVREGGEFEAHGHDHGEGHGHDDHGHQDEKHEGHAHGENARPEHPEAHVWLETGNAAAMARAMAEHLARADPGNAARYRANAETLSARLAALGEELHEMLEPVEDRPFVVFHDAWAHFETQFHLRAVGSITISSEVQPGARRISRLKSRVSDLGAVCVFAEPQFDSRLVATIADGTAVRVGIADPLGADIPPGPGHYETLMRRAAAAFRDCLGG